MNLKQFEYALTLARVGSFSVAAEMLGISQPSLSQYIKKLEKQAGAILFDRTNSDIRLTDAGKIYIEAGRKILDIEHQMKMSFCDISSHKSGTITIGATPYRSAGLMPLVTRRFLDKYPGMNVVVGEHTIGELIEGASHGEFDLSIVLLPVDEHLFQYEKIMEEELVLAVPASCPPLKATKMEGRRYEAIDMSAIDGKSFVMITENQVMQRFLNNICADFHLNLKTAAVVKALESQINMVRAGVGFALVPTGIERFCASNEVRFYSFKEELPRRQVVAMWPKDRELSGVAKNMLKIIKEFA